MTEILNTMGYKTKKVTGKLALKYKNMDKYAVYGKLKGSDVGDYHTWCELDSDGKIYIVDPLYGFPNKDRIFVNAKSFIKGVIKGDILNTNSANEFMQKIFSKSLLDQAEYIKQELPKDTYTEDEKFLLAEELLRKYSTAKLVITSRIHCALPCLALGTPVIYLQGFEKEFDAFIAFIASGGQMGRSTTELNDQFSGVMNSDKVRERLNWLIDEKKIMKSVGAKYTNFYFLK